jgi:DNA-binding protein
MQTDEMITGFRNKLFQPQTSNLGYGINGRGRERKSSSASTIIRNRSVTSVDREKISIASTPVTFQKERTNQGSNLAISEFFDKKSSRAIYLVNCQKLIPFDINLARNYLFEPPPGQNFTSLCRLNAKLALSVGKPDIAQIWRIVELIVKRPTPSDSVRSSKYSMFSNQQPFLSGLLHRVLKYLEATHDLQTLAAISITLEIEARLSHHQKEYFSIESLSAQTELKRQIMQGPARLQKEIASLEMENSFPHRANQTLEETTGKRPSNLPAEPWKDIMNRGKMCSKRTEWEYFLKSKAQQQLRKNSESLEILNAVEISSRQQIGDIDAISTPMPSSSQLNLRYEDCTIKGSSGKWLSPSIYARCRAAQILFVDMLCRTQLHEQRAVVEQLLGKCIHRKSSQELMEFQLNAVIVCPQCGGQIFDNNMYKRGSYGGGNIVQTACHCIPRKQAKSVKCDICRLTVRGAGIFCPICGHGGHLNHIREWFLSAYGCCPARGCECNCGFS